MKKQIKTIGLIILIFGALVILRLVTNKSTKGAPLTSAEAKQKVAVKVMPVKKEDLNLILSYVGSLKAKDEINVYSKVPGKLVEYTVNEGDRVEKGQTIAFIDRDETGLKFELAKVESPLSGVVGRTLQDKGASIVPTAAAFMGGVPLAIIVNMDEMIVRLNIPETDIPYIKKGLTTQVKVDAYPQDNFSGEVSKVSEVVDTQTRTLPIEIAIPNPEHRLKSGMFCRIDILATQLKDRLVLSQDAVVQELGTSYVFVVQDYTAKKKRVTLGIRDNGKIEVLDGLTEGQIVIVFGQQGLKDGTEVAVVGE